MLILFQKIILRAPIKGYERLQEAIEAVCNVVETVTLLAQLEALRNQLPSGPEIIKEFESLLQDIGQENKLELSNYPWLDNIPHENELREPWKNLTDAILQGDDDAVLYALRLLRERLQVRAAYMRLREEVKDSSEERLVIQVRGKGYHQLLLDKIQGGKLQVRLVFQPISSQDEKERVWNIPLSQISLDTPDPNNPEIVNIVANLRLDKIFDSIYDVYKYITVAQVSFDGENWYSSEPNPRSNEVQEHGVVVVVPQETHGPESEEILESLRMYSHAECSTIAHDIVEHLKDQRHLVGVEDQILKHLEASLSLGFGMIQKTGAIIASTDGTPLFPYWYPWLRDSWKALQFYIELYELTRVKELHDIIQRYIRFILTSDAMVHPSVQRLNILGYALYDPKKSPEEFKQTQHAPRWGEDPSWGDQHDGPAHALQAVFDYLPLLQADDNALRKDIEVLIDVNVRHLVDVVLEELPSDDLWEEITARYHVYTALLQFDVLSDVLEQGLITDDALLNNVKKAVAKLRALFDSTNKNGFIQKLQERKRLVAHLEPVGEAAVKLEKTKPDTLDASVIGAICHVRNIQRALKLIGYEALLNTLMALDERFKQEYPVNRSGQLLPETILWGRYGDDIYNGDPYSRFVFTKAGAWVLISLWRIQTLISLSEGLLQGQINALDGTLQTLLQNLDIHVDDGEMRAQKIAYSLKDIARVNLRELSALAPGPGKFAEQLDRYNGTPRGVQPLGWSQWEYVKTVLRFAQLEATLVEINASPQSIGSSL